MANIESKNEFDSRCVICYSEDIKILIPMTCCKTKETVKYTCKTCIVQLEKCPLCRKEINYNGTISYI